MFLPLGAAARRVSSTRAPALRRRLSLFRRLSSSALTLWLAFLAIGQVALAHMVMALLITSQWCWMGGARDVWL